MRTRERYRGVLLEARPGKRWKHTRLYVGGVFWGEWYGENQERHLASFRSIVDDAAERPEAYGPEWKAAA